MTRLPRGRRMWHASPRSTVAVIAACGVAASVLVAESQALAPLPPQHVAAGQVVFGCVLRPDPPKQRVGPPGLTSSASVRCDQSHTPDRIILSAQQYIPPHPGYRGASWGNAVHPLKISTLPIPANRAVTVSGHLSLDCNPNDAAGHLGTPGTYRTELLLWIVKSRRPFRYRILAADSSSASLSCK